MVKHAAILLRQPTTSRIDSSREISDKLGGDSMHAVVISSEDAANFASDKVSAAGQYLPPVVKLDDVEVREVLQHA